MATTAPAPDYDPYDFDIDADPYPVWKRLRDEAPLYYNEKYEFYAVSRYDDVERCLVEWQTYSSAKGSVLEMIKAEIQMPPGMFIFEDPPDHDLHRGIMSRVFTPKRMAAIEPQVRDYAARALDPLAGPAASTSSRTWAPRSRCAPSACSSGFPRRTSRRSVTTSTRACAWSPARCPRSFPWRTGPPRTTAPTSTGAPSTPPTT